MVSNGVSVGGLNYTCSFLNQPKQAPFKNVTCLYLLNTGVGPVNAE